MVLNIGPYFIYRGLPNWTDVRIAIYKIGAILGLHRAIYFRKKDIGLISKR